MRRLKMFEGGLLAPQEEERSVNADAIASMASRLTIVGRHRRMQRSESDIEPEPDEESWAATRLAAGWQTLGTKAASFGAALGKQRANGRTIVQMTMLSGVAVAGSSMLLDWANARAGLLDREVSLVVEAAPAALAGTDLLQAGLTSAASALPLQDWADRLPAWRPITLPRLAAVTDRPAAKAEAAPAPHIREALARRPLPVSPPILHAPILHAPVLHLPVLQARAWRPEVRPYPPIMVAHAEPRPRVVPHVTTAKFELPRWLVEGHPSRETGLVMSEPAHELAIFHSKPASAAVSPPTVAKAMQAMAQPAQAAPLPPVVAAPPRYAMAAPYGRPAYGYGYGYGTPFRQAYGSPYGGAYMPPPPPGYPYYQ